MRIAIIGASGFVGGALLAEALERGHEVLAIVRHAEVLPQASAPPIRVARREPAGGPGPAHRRP